MIWRKGRAGSAPLPDAALPVAWRGSTRPRWRYAPVTLWVSRRLTLHSRGGSLAFADELRTGGWKLRCQSLLLHAVALVITGSLLQEARERRLSGIPVEGIRQTRASLHSIAV